MADLKKYLMPAAVLIGVYFTFFQGATLDQILNMVMGIIILIAVGLIGLRTIEKLLNPPFDALQRSRDDLIKSAIGNYDGKGLVYVNGKKRGRVIGYTEGAVDDKGKATRRAIVVAKTRGLIRIGKLDGRVFGKGYICLLHPALFKMLDGSIWVNSSIQRYGEMWGCVLDPRWTMKGVSNIETDQFNFSVLRKKYEGMGDAFAKHELTNTLFQEARDLKEKAVPVKT